jgi:hypothetical protein
MAATSTPEAKRLAKALVDQFGEDPIRPRDLPAKLVALDSSVLVELLDVALSYAAAADDPTELDETLWGPEPTEAEVRDARRGAHAVLDDYLGAALDDTLRRDEAAQRLGISPQAVSKRLAGGRLVALSRGREKRFPTWQFYEDGVLPGLADLIAVFPGGALSLTNWATTPSPDLDGLPPAEGLARRGGVARVVEAARSLTPAAW